MCRLPRQICLLLSVAMLSVATLSEATPQLGRPHLVDSRPPLEYDQSDPSEPDWRLLSHYLNTRREDLADLFNDDSTRGLAGPEQDRQDQRLHPADDLASLYKQLDLVTMVMDVLSGKYTPRSADQEGITFPEGVLLPDEYQRPNQQPGQPSQSDIAELFERMQQDNNLGARLRRAADNARVHEPRGKDTGERFTASDGKGGTISGEEVNCVPGKRAWPTCKLLTTYKIESFHVRPHEEENSKDGARGQEKKHLEQGSVSVYGEGKKIEGMADDDQGAEEEHASTEKSGSRKKRESNNKEVWNDALEGTGGKRAPDFHSWGGKRAQQVDLNEIYNSDSSPWGDKRAPEFNSWGGKRSGDSNNWGGKGALESSCRGGKRRTAFNNWGGKRGPSFNSWGGKRSPSFNSWGGKRAPEFNSWGGKRSPAFNSWGGKRAPAFNSWGGKRAPEFNSWGGKRKPAFNSWGGKRSTWMLQKLVDNKNTPVIASAANDDLFDERGLGSDRTKVGKRGTADGIRAMIKAPNLPAIRSRSAGFYPWGGKRSDSSLLQ